MKRIIGMDVGDKRIGIAVSDPLGITAQGVCVYERQSLRRDAEYIISLAGQYGASDVVSGIPRNMDGTYGAQAKSVERFCAELTQRGLNVIYQDERLTTVAAHSAMIEGGVRRENRKRGVDMVAASLILQTYLNKGGLIMDNNESMDMETDLIELTDEDGETTQFAHVATVEYNEEVYILLSPVDEDEDDENEDEEEEVVIMRVEEGEDGEDYYVGIDDDALMEAVFEKYLAEAEEDEE